MNLYRFASVSSTPQINIGNDIFGMDLVKQAIKEDENDSYGYDNQSENEDDEQQNNENQVDKFQRNKLGLAFE